MPHHHLTPLYRLLTPLLQTIRPPSSTSTLRQHALSSFSLRSFSTTPSILAGGRSSKDKGKKTDPRITLIRYHLQHPKTPRPLRFSRLRALRHWTIHRAWMLFQRKKKAAESLELQRMYQTMQAACEELRLLDDPKAKDAGRLYRIAMGKQGIFRAGGVPIEYARAQTDTPAAEAWDHNWKR